MPRMKIRLRHCATLFAALATVGLVLSCSLSCSDNPSQPNDTEPPQVTITAPPDGDTLRTDTTLVEVTATDNRAVAKVEFYADGTLLGSDTQVPYTYAWVWGELRATAVDKAGNSASDTIAVYLPYVEPPDTVPPIVAITSPQDGAVVGGYPTITATASDTGEEGVGIASVTFYAGATLLGVDTESPYELLWDTTGLSNGQEYALSATAEDLAGNTAADTVQVTLQAGLDAPDVAILTPPGSALNSSQSIRAGATDAGGVAVVRFYVDDVLVGSDEEAPYEQPALALLYWADGTRHDVAAEAEDFAGNMRRSHPVAISITKPATAWLSQVLAVAGPGDADGYDFTRLVRLNPQVRYRGSKIDTIAVNTCIQGNTALIDYEKQGGLYVMPVPPPGATRFHIDRCIIINAQNNVRLPVPPQTGLSWGGAIEFESIPGWEEPFGQVTHCTICQSSQSGIYLHRSRADRILIKNNIFFSNQLGGCVRYADDVTPVIRYNCANQNQACQFGEHCGCPSNVTPTEIYITDPDEQLGTNTLADPGFPAITKPPFTRSRREHFVLGLDTPCRNQGEDGTYIGAMPPE
jgi:hypothetical protein